MIVDKFKKHFFRKKWRKTNSHNLTEAFNIFDPNFVKVGKHTYGSLFVLNFSNKYKLEIGNYCSIGPGVIFSVCSDHQFNRISTYPMKVKVCGDEYEATSKGDIVIKDDVWIGANSIVLSGITIDQGAVIAAGSIVTKDVPPYAIVAGNPAKIIKYRFSEEIIKKLLKIDYSKLDNTTIKNNINLLYDEVDNNNVDKIISIFEN